MDAPLDSTFNLNTDDSELDFASIMTEKYDLLEQYFPEFKKLK